MLQGGVQRVRQHQHDAAVAPCCPAAARCVCSAGWLRAGTVHFFLNSSATGRGFPLYSRAIRLAHNREGMVRAAVRTLTLNVYSVPDPDIIAHVTSPPACQYFADMAQYLAEQVQVGRRRSCGAGACAWGSSQGHACKVGAAAAVWRCWPDWLAGWLTVGCAWLPGSPAVAAAAAGPPPGRV